MSVFPEEWEECKEQTDPNEQLDPRRLYLRWVEYKRFIDQEKAKNTWHIQILDMSWVYRCFAKKVSPSIPVVVGTVGTVGIDYVFDVERKIITVRFGVFVKKTFDEFYAMMDNYVDFNTGLSNYPEEMNVFAYLVLAFLDGFDQLSAKKQKHWEMVRLKTRVLKFFGEDYTLSGNPNWGFVCGKIRAELGRAMTDLSV